MYKYTIDTQGRVYGGGGGVKRPERPQIYEKG
jgi:hypothetical protein